MNIMPKIKPIALVSLLVLVGFGASPCRAQMIDDFESYADSAALNSAWSATGAVVTLDTTTPNDGGGTQSANVSWQNVPGNSGYGFNLTLATPADWTGETLSVWVRRQSTSASTTNFFFMLMDTTMGICPSGPDLSVTDTNWHLYSYDLSMCGGGFNPASIQTVAISIGNGTGIPADVAANIDDLSLDGSVPVELLSFEVE